jgi:hypothetical protein
MNYRAASVPFLILLDGMGLRQRGHTCAMLIVIRAVLKLQFQNSFRLKTLFHKALARETAGRVPKPIVFWNTSIIHRNPLCPLCLLLSPSSYFVHHLPYLYTFLRNF